MADVHAIVVKSLSERYKMLAETVHELAGPLNDEQFWRKPFPFGNSFGHLVLHLTGNLNYYIGTQIAGTGYVRDRDREFSEKDRPAKAEVLKRFDHAIALVVQTIGKQTAQDWPMSYSAAREEDAESRFNIFLRCCTHLHHHVGQMMYLANGLKSLET